MDVLFYTENLTELWPDDHSPINVDLCRSAVHHRRKVTDTVINQSSFKSYAKRDECLNRRVKLKDDIEQALKDASMPVLKKKNHVHYAWKHCLLTGLS